MSRFLMIAAALCCLGGNAVADVAGVYLQGHGGYGGATAGELEPGGEEPSLGAALGAELGVRIMAFGAYVNYDRHLHRGSIIRGILGLEGDLGLAGFKLTGRVGAGLILDQDGLLMGSAGDHKGVAARAGVALDRRLSPGLWLGFGLDGEYFALKGTGDMESSVHTGADIFASLRLRVEMGI